MSTPEITPESPDATSRIPLLSHTLNSPDQNRDNLEVVIVPKSPADQTSESIDALEAAAQEAAAQEAAALEAAIRILLLNRNRAPANNVDQTSKPSREEELKEFQKKLEFGYLFVLGIVSWMIAHSIDKVQGSLFWSKVAYSVVFVLSWAVVDVTIADFRYFLCVSRGQSRMLFLAAALTITATVVLFVDRVMA